MDNASLDQIRLAIRWCRNEYARLHVIIDNSREAVRLGFPLPDIAPDTPIEEIDFDVIRVAMTAPEGEVFRKLNGALEARIPWLNELDVAHQMLSPDRLDDVLCRCGVKVAPDLNADQKRELLKHAVIVDEAAKWA